MTDQLTRDIWTIAYQVCTEKELQALRYKSAGYGYRRIARLLNISPPAVRDRLEAAERKINKAKEAA